MAYFDTSGAAFDELLRMLETTDPVHANTFNPLFRQLINNDVALKEAFSELSLTKNKQAEFLLNLHKTAKKYGVHFDDFAINPSSVGTRLFDAVGMVALPSTDTVRAQNDFESESVFYHLEANGYVDEDGEFVVQYIKDLDPEFSRTARDVWCLYLTQWISITIDANGENKVLSDVQFPGSFPEGGAIRPDGTIRSFVPIAKYMAGKNSSNVESSISGVVATQHSHTSSITAFKSKGTQYCGQTAQDWEHLRNLFEVAFASRHSESVMAGCSYYWRQTAASVIETDVERIIVPKSDASYFVVGSAVSIGNATALNNGVPNQDRGQAGMHAKASRRTITKIEEYDTNNSAIYIDNGGSTFGTGSTTVDGVTCPTVISTMQWRTGGCDNVLGSCGSPINNLSGKEPFVLFGVEMALGYWEPMGNCIMYVENHVMNPYICYDCTKLSTSGKTSDYTKVNINIPDNDASWKYISRMGFDTENPSVRFPSEAAADSSKGYADGLYTEDLDTLSDGTQREVLCAGVLDIGARDGLWLATLIIGLSDSNWNFAARLSATGRCGREAA